MVSPTVPVGKQRRIAFVIDLRNWALDNIVDNISPMLEPGYQVTRYYAEDYKDNLSALLTGIFIDNAFDNVHFMWRKLLFSVLRSEKSLYKVMELAQLTCNDLATRISAPVVTSTVYDHLFLDDEGFESRRFCYDFLDGYSVSSEILRSIYENRLHINPCALTEDGVNLQLFAPHALSRFENHERSLVVGWVGNSKWGANRRELGLDPKGLHSVVTPAVERLQSQGFNVTAHFADRNETWRSRAQMAEYYSEIDVLICASEAEGTPNPVLEAMACGVPVISTRVGIVEQALGDVQSAFILSERSSEALEVLLRRLIGNRHLMALMSQENLAQVKSWTWQHKLPGWLQLLQHAEAEHAQKRMLKKRWLQTKFEKIEEASELNKQVTVHEAKARKLKEQVDTGKTEVDKLKKQVDRHRREIKKMRGSVTYRVGIAMVEAYRDPLRKGWRLPVTLLGLMRERARVAKSS